MDFAVVELPLAGDAVAGCVGVLAHEQLGGLQEVVDERGFAHVGAAHDADVDGLFEVWVFLGGAAPGSEGLLGLGEGLGVRGVLVQLTVVLRVGV